MTRETMIRQFEEEFGADGGEIRFFSAPGRINLIGDHTDGNGGHVFTCALSLRTWAAVRKTDGNTVRMAARHLGDGMREFRLDSRVEAQPEDGWLRRVKAVYICLGLRSLKADFGMDILLDSDIPVGTGLGSSTALEVLMAFIFREMYSLRYITRSDLARAAYAAETDILGLPASVLSPITCARGREGCALFLETDKDWLEYVPLKLGDARIVITDSGVKEPLSTEVIRERETECAKALKKLQNIVNVKHLCSLEADRFESSKDVIMDPVLTKRARFVIYEEVRTIRAVSAMRVGNLERFGEFMNQSHQALRDEYEVSCPELDLLAETAWPLEGVVGSRMTGGGFDGCTVSIVKETALDSFRETILRAYRDRFGREPHFYVVESSDGVREETAYDADGQKRKGEEVGA